MRNPYKILLPTRNYVSYFTITAFARRYFSQLCISFYVRPLCLRFLWLATFTPSKLIDLCFCVPMDSFLVKILDFTRVRVSGFLETCFRSRNIPPLKPFCISSDSFKNKILDFTRLKILLRRGVFRNRKVILLPNISIIRLVSIALPPENLVFTLI